MSVPIVAIVGRPNVGKSSIFNWLVGQRIAIVDPTSGVTRDRIDREVEFANRTFQLTDTGGMGVEDKDGLTEEVERQIAFAIHQAHVVLFVVDAQTGRTDLDFVVSKKLKSIDKPVILVANKSDNIETEYQATEYYKLGREPLFVSVTRNRGKKDLLHAIVENLPEEIAIDERQADMKIAVVGQRNVGKSTFINSLAGQERVIVSEIPGTTRDSVDIIFDHGDRRIIAIDTAGVRRKRSLADDIEFYSFNRLQKTVRRADIILFFFDARNKISKPDKQLLHYINDHYKPCIFVINKWDLVDDIPTSQYDEYLSKIFPTMDWAPRAFITAKDGKNVHALIDLCRSIRKQMTHTVPTGLLNRIIKQAQKVKMPPVRQNRRPKIYYATQVSNNPPTIAIYCNNPKLFDPTWQRFLVNYFREQFPFEEVPIKVEYRRSDRKEGGKEIPQVDIMERDISGNDMSEGD